MNEAHWLFRLDAHGWLAAAHVELAACVGADSRRTVVAHARRAGGMAMNGVLVAWSQREPELDAESVWGRSYVDHLRAIADGATGPLERDASVSARAVLATPMAAPPLVSLGKRNPELDALREHTRALVLACAAAIERLLAL